MIDARGKKDQFSLPEREPNPALVCVANVKVSAPAKEVPDLLVLVHVLLEEHLDYVLVFGAQRVGGDNDRVPVLVGAFGGEFVDGGDIG